MRQVVMIVAFALAVGVIAFLLVGSPSKSGPDIPAPDRVRATPTSVLRAEVPTPTPRRVVPERTSPHAS